MQPRSWLTRLLAVALAAVLVSGYAGPGICAAVHGRAVAPAETDHCQDAAPHGPDRDTSGSPHLAAAPHVVGCPDAAHCGAGVAGPLVRQTSALVVDLADYGPIGVRPSHGRALSTAPPAPPPKV